MKFGSVCSGIEAASVAWESLGFEAQWFSEIEHFPSEVLKYRFPAVENLGDMTKLTTNETFKASTIDLLVGGTPCQSFSVAGLRGGLADPRGNLMLTFLSLADAKKPRWIVWENVPGVLSSNGGKDFGTFLGALGELGYGFAFRILNAEHFGIPQRRRRVFVVGYLGDWRVAAAVLFERESLQGNPKPSRKKREEVTTDAKGGVGKASEISCAGGNLSPTVTSKWKTGYGGPSGSNETGNMVYAPTVIDQSESRWVSPNGEEAIGTIMARDYKGLGNQDLEDGRGLAIRPHAVAQPISIDAECNARTNQFGTLVRGGEGGTQQFVAQPMAFQQNTRDEVRYINGDGSIVGALSASSGMKQTNYLAQPIAIAENTTGRQPMNGGNGDGFTEDGPMYTLNATGVHGVAQPLYYESHPNDSRVNGPKDVAHPVHAFKVRGGCEGGGKGYLGEDEKAFTISTTQDQQIAQPISWDSEVNCNINKMGTIVRGGQGGRTDGVAQPIAVDWRTAQVDQGITQTLKTDLAKMSGPCVAVDTYNQTVNERTSQTIRSDSNADQIGAVLQKMAIRRLTPIETELLQGFPRNWTQIPYRNKPADQCPDGPRYKACGNSMAVPVMRWIGQRIQLIDTILNG
jgi:DNA (cytosine-5)-methyltransferase 1